MSTRELRERLSGVIGRTMYAGQQIDITRNGKLAVIMISVADLEALKAFEMDQDLAAYREAKVTDDGGRISIAELRSEFVS